MEKWQNPRNIPWKNGRYTLYLSWKSGNYMVVGFHN